MYKRKIGMWLYSNGGGAVIQEKIVKKLREREIQTITDLNLRNALAKNKNIVCNDVNMNQLDLYFSYNAGEQTQYQMYLYKALNRIIPTLNSYESFELTEDKFQTSFLLSNNGIKTANYNLCHRDDIHYLQFLIANWKKMVYKPTDGWGGVGLTKIDSQETLDMVMPFLNQMDLRYFYVEKFIDYDNTDYRVDVVNGKLVGCYGRRAGIGDWRTNITSGGSIFKRELNDEVANLALQAAKIAGLDIAGIDIIYDREHEEYLVLEVNGIPAFATPEQEKMGLNFNDKKIDLIVDLIDKKTQKAIQKERIFDEQTEVA
ncbi:ATP-grasp domain-containing protein [Sulfurospirillum arcachonense]|uniref:ATP-grasp domain-containing protein n=1 Tax=Sulfurospirillum arcachonense TaxID=57666 RepID=UPI000468AB17|nr:ATP-grasp domain-containing protein [Sulfurospirillum arcachonense]